MTTGWRNSFFIVSMVTLAIAIICWLVVRDDQQHCRESCLELAASTDYPSKEASFHGITQALNVVFKNKNNWYIFFTSFGLVGSLLAFTGSWSVPYLMQIYGFTRSQSANFMLAVILGKMVGFPLIGYLSDRFSRRKAPLLAFLSIHIMLWSLLYFWNLGKPPANGLMVIFFLMGLTGAALVLIIALSKEVNHPSYAGTAMSVVNIAPFLGISVIQPLMGYALELRWDGMITMGVKIYPLAAYRLLFATCLLVLLISFYFALKIQETN